MNQNDILQGHQIFTQVPINPYPIVQQPVPITQSSNPTNTLPKNLERSIDQFTTEELVSELYRRVYTMIDKTSSQFKRGMKEEAHEHPQFSKKQINTIVTDHLKIHPSMYKK